jgi:hypothetical protein
MSDPVPAIAEASATGAVAELFADIRLVLGVEVVNLIWRHLATIPDALPRAWGMLRVHFTPTARSPQRLRPSAAGLRCRAYRRSQPTFWPRSAWAVTSLPQSATSSPLTTGPMRWP